MKVNKRQTSNKIRSRIARSLKRIMKESNISSKQLASCMGCHYSNVNRILRGSHGISVSTLVKLCYYLNVTPNDVINFHEPVNHLLYNDKLQGV